MLFKRNRTVQTLLVYLLCGHCVVMHAFVNVIFPSLRFVVFAVWLLRELTFPAVLRGFGAVLRSRSQASLVDMQSTR